MGGPSVGIGYSSGVVTIGTNTITPGTGGTGGTGGSPNGNVGLSASTHAF
jgi:hypothetical protein